VLNEIVLFVAKLMFLALLLINLVYLLLPSKAISQENKLEYRIEHSLLAITGAIGLAVLQFI
jgi:hypothetical protein